MQVEPLPAEPEVVQLGEGTREAAMKAYQEALHKQRLGSGTRTLSAARLREELARCEQMLLDGRRDEAIGDLVYWTSNPGFAALSDLPEGRYRVRVIASDELSNPPDQVTRHELQSSLVTVDNTPPTLLELKANGRTITAVAVDGVGPIARVEMSLAGRDEWFPFHPLDGLFDEQREELEADVSSLVPAGPALLSIRVYDQAGNVTVRSVTILNPPEAPNTDGINPDSCRRVRISDCHVDVGDDCIALKAGIESEAPETQAPCEDVAITNCTLARGHGRQQLTRLRAPRKSQPPAPFTCPRSRS